MISVLTARNLAIQGSIIPKDVWQRVETATDLDMAIHAQPHKDNER